MRQFFVIFYFIVNFYFFLNVVLTDQFSTERPFVTPYRAKFANRRKHIDVLTPTDSRHGGGHVVNLDAQARNRVLANLPNARRKLLAGARNNTATALAGPRLRSGARLVPKSGGVVNAGRHRGLMANNRGSDGSVNANFTLNGRHKLNTQGEGAGGKDKFWANGTRRIFGIDPLKQNRRDGEGILYFSDRRRQRNEYFLYEIENSGNQEFAASVAEPENNEQQPSGPLGNLFRQRAKKYRCEARRVGESNCFDQNGKSVGKVVVNNRGEAVVYSKHGIPIYRGRVQRRGNRSYVSVVNNGLMQADVEHFEERECLEDLGGQKGKYNIKLQQPLTFTYHTTKRRNGDTVIRWPDCFDISGQVQLGPGVDPERMAFEWIVNLRPIGRLRCMDPGTCKKDCYYCNACSSRKHKMDILDNTDSNICEAKGNNRYQMKVTVCPTPKVFNWALCSNFTRFSADDYWKKQGDLDVQMRIWLRPRNEREKAREFHNIMDSPLGPARRLGFLAEWAKDEGLQQGRINPTNQELKEWYIHKDNPDEIILCRRSVVEWGLGGSKVDSSFLVETLGAAASFPDVIGGTRCPKWDQLMNLQYEDEKNVLNPAQSNGRGRVGTRRLFGNLFGGPNRNN